MASKSSMLKNVTSFFDDAAECSDGSSDPEEAEPNEYDRNDGWIDDKSPKRAVSSSKARALRAQEDTAEDARLRALAARYDKMANDDDEDAYDDDDDDDDDDGLGDSVDEVAGRAAGTATPSPVASPPRPSGRVMASDVFEEAMKSDALQRAADPWAELEKKQGAALASVMAAAAAGSSSASKAPKASKAAAGGGGEGDKKDKKALVSKVLKDKEPFFANLKRPKAQRHVEIADAILMHPAEVLKTNNADVTAPQLRDLLAVLTDESGAPDPRRGVGLYVENDDVRAFIAIGDGPHDPLYKLVPRELHRAIWPAQHIDELKKASAVLEIVLWRMRQVLEKPGAPNPTAWSSLQKQQENFPLVRRLGNGTRVPVFDTTYMQQVVKTAQAPEAAAGKQAASPLKKEAAPPARQPAQPAPAAEDEDMDDAEVKEVAQEAAEVIEKADGVVKQAERDFKDGSKPVRKPTVSSARMDALMQHVISKSAARSASMLPAFAAAEGGMQVYMRGEAVFDADEIAKTMKAMSQFLQGVSVFGDRVPAYIVATKNPVTVANGKKKGAGAPAAPAEASEAAATEQDGSAARPAKAAAASSRYMTSTSASAVRAKEHEKKMLALGNWVVMCTMQEFKTMSDAAGALLQEGGGVEKVDTFGVTRAVEQIRQSAISGAKEMREIVWGVCGEEAGRGVLNALLAMVSMFAIKKEDELAKTMPMIMSMMRKGRESTETVAKLGAVYDEVMEVSRTKSAASGPSMSDRIREHAMTLVEEATVFIERGSKDNASESLTIALLCFRACFLVEEK